MCSDSEDLLMVFIIKFYNQKNNINKLLSILNKETRISLRLIDWFITNYCKKYNITILKKQKNNNIIHFNIYLSYKAQLKAYSKKYFDPFKRRERIKFNYRENEHIETTIGQLNLFKWLFQNEIINYIEDNIDAIENDMTETQKLNKKKQLKNKNMNLYTENTIIHFE